MGESWNPWRALRDRPHIRFALSTLPEATGGAVYGRAGDRGAIIIDRSLTRRDRNAALAHELIHDEHGGGCPGGDGPPAQAVVARRHEARVRREVARRLVPLDDLAAVVASIEANELPWSVLEIAEIFDVPVGVAELALGQTSAASSSRGTGTTR